VLGFLAGEYQHALSLIRQNAPAHLTSQVPQLIENYKNGRADAVSLGFLLAWFCERSAAKFLS
jgi:hypothetical protein